MAFLLEEEKSIIKQNISFLANEFDWEIGYLSIGNDGYICFEVIMDATRINHIDFEKIYPELLERKLFTVDQVEMYLYETDRDYEWYLNYSECQFPMSMLRDAVSEAIPRLSEDELYYILDDSSCVEGVRVRGLAEEIVKQFKFWYVKSGNRVGGA